MLFRSDGAAFFKRTLGKPELWTAVGLKKGDSARRRMKLTKVGYLEPKAKMAYPICEYSTRDVYELLKQTGIRLSADYPIYGSSFDAMSLKYWVRAKLNDPETWKYIRLWYPMAPAMIAKDRFRREKYGKEN